ncbi:hypothetical protein HanRHA438_Chr04g0177031 [Helianthus annuus]|nr:hypothetical protein HanRHA438_Chr04g0177031 [Helianthus annuus]
MVKSSLPDHVPMLVLTSHAFPCIGSGSPLAPLIHPLRYVIGKPSLVASFGVIKLLLAPVSRSALASWPFISICTKRSPLGASRMLLFTDADEESLVASHSAILTRLPVYAVKALRTCNCIDPN